MTGYFKRHLCFGAVLLTAGLLFCASVLAQQTTGAISGTIKDSTGGVVPNAQITLRDTDKNAVVRTMSTSDSGDFAFPQLPVGHYSIIVEAQGFQK